MTTPPALDDFCRREYPRLTRMLDAYLGDLHVAEELAQEALLRAARRWDRVEALESPGGWAHRVAINLANSWFRRQQAARRARRRLGPVDDVHLDPDTPAALAVRAALTTLPERQRTAVLLRHHAEYSVAETAEAMAISKDAVRSLTKRAVARLRNELSDHEADDQEADHVRRH